MNILVCYKIVPEEQDIAVNSNRTLSFDKAEWKVGDYDLMAVEAGVKLAETHQGSAYVLSIGGKQLDNSKLKKSILSRGPSEAFLVMDDKLIGADAYNTANVLAATAKKIGFDLIICGEGSADIYAKQVGAQLGELLDLPVVNNVTEISINGDVITVKRSLENEIETLEAKLPVVISVSSSINTPRLPSMKDILAAGKKKVIQWNLSDIGVGCENVIDSVSLLAPEESKRKCEILEGDSDEIITRLAEVISKAAGR